MTYDPILEDFSHQVRRRSGDTMLESAATRITVGEVDRLAAGLARRLAAAGFAPDDLVGLAAVNGSGFVAGFLGIRRLGGRVLLIDRVTPPPERAAIISQLGAVGAVVCPSPWPRSADELMIECADEGSPKSELPAGTAVIRLTSGSTGRPQGIAHTARALATDDDALARTMGLMDRERILAAIPLSHAYGFASVFLPALRRPSVLVVPSGDGPFAVMDAVARGGATFLPTVPAYVQAVLKMADPPPLDPSIRLVITAGAPLRPETAISFRGVYGRPIHVFYGASEVGGICFDRTGTAGERGTLGEPVDGVDVRLTEVAGVEVGGLVEVRSPSAALGYVPVADRRLQDGRFQTSDLGRWIDRELVLTGRADELINVRGKKVNPREVEAVIAAIDSVDEVVVFGGPSTDGDGDLVRAVVACPSGDLDYVTVRRWCADRLSAHKVPRSVAIVEQIPRTDRGKIDRAAVRRMATVDA
jgi:long-chain acyl-CoA synthetase